jgi:hypothetical protein
VPERDALFAELQVAFAAHGGPFHSCLGPGDLGCWVTQDANARNILVVVCADAQPSSELEQLAAEWTARDGFEALGLVRDDLDADDVLPTALRPLNAVPWQMDVREVLPELVDSVLLDAEDRRIFISYAHADGSATAERTFNLLARARFDVFLDRFRLAPGVDFLKRIEDEILDKAMIVVIETAEAMGSPWVHQEVAIAISRGLGIAALNLGTVDGFWEISDELRCRDDDDDIIRDFLIDQHRTQLVDRREGMRESAWEALRQAGVEAADILETHDGFWVNRPAGRRLVGLSVRPADLHRFRLVGERMETDLAYLVHPQPAIQRRRRDLTWLSDVSRIVEVDSGRLVEAADEIAHS